MIDGILILNEVAEYLKLVEKLHISWLPWVSYSALK